MKLPVLILLFCLYFAAAFAQPTQNIKGTLIDSAKNQPLGYATVAIQTIKTAKPVKATLSKDNGSFEFTGLPLKGYQLVIASVGFKNKIIAIDNIKTQIDLGNILMHVATKDLNEVSVTALRPIMKQEVDRISYDVQADPESKAITALDMMRKVPMLAVDGNEKIKLKGSGNYKILINNKESALMARNPSDILKAMPASNIEKIEVITTPPARYDAEGLAGIINIITKKNVDQGYNGSIGGRYNSVWGPGINLNATVKQGKFGAAVNGGADRQNKQTFENNNRQTFFSDNTTILQNGVNTFSGHDAWGNAELSYEIDTLDLLTASLNYWRGKGNEVGTRLSQQFSGTGSLFQRFLLTNEGQDIFQGFDASVNYQRSFSKQKDRLLTLSYQYTNSPFQSLNNLYLSQQFNYNLPDYNQFNRAGDKAHTIQLDYAHPFKKLSVEGGAKAILRNNYSDFRSENFNTVTNVYELNPDATNEFNYHQDVYSIYNSYQLKLEKWTAKAGLRLEHTRIGADFTSTGNTLDRNYSNLIPSVSAQRMLKSSSFTLGFTQRIQRPGIWQLNPFVNRSNPKFINVGNPGLRPELNNTFEFNYSNFKKGSINTTLSYAFSNNAIQNITTSQAGIINGQPDIITTTTYQNLGSNRSLGLNFSVNQSAGKNLTVTLNGQLSHVWLKGTFGDTFYTNDGTIGNASLNLSYKLPKNFRINTDADYFSGEVTLQGRNRGVLFNSLVATKEFLDEKASISLVANNPYGKYFLFKSYTTTAEFDQRSENRNYYRSFAVRFNYKFGRLKGEIKRNQRGINNDDTKAGKK